MIRPLHQYASEWKKFLLTKIEFYIPGKVTESGD